MCGDVVGSGCAGEGGIRCFRPRGCCVLVGLVVFVRGLRPVPPCFWSVGGGAPVGGIVCAEDAGLCVVQKRGLSPLTPVVTSQGCPPVLRGMVEVCHLGGAELVVDKQHGARREQVSAPPTLLASLLFLLYFPARQHLYLVLVSVSCPVSAVRLQGYCLCFTHGAPSMALNQRGS